MKSISEQDIITLVDLWGFLGAATLQPTNHGVSNSTYFVDAQAGQFILKLYGDSTATEQIQYEHSILAYLQVCDLSFAVPAPVPINSGETLLSIDKNDTVLRVALFPRLPGQSANRENLNHARAAGQALGEMHCALARFDPKGKLAQLPAWGDLYHIHPLVKDPLEVPQLLGLNSNQQARLIKTLTEVLIAKPQLYATLPVQTTHADFLCPNILLKDNQVVGVLDFEFATRDLRLMDYICGLDHFSIYPRKEAPRWEWVEAFSAGYAKYISLTQQETEAIAMAWRLQRASCIVYWTGWFYEGKVTHQSVVDAVVETILLEEWLEDNATKIVNYLK
ncbi:phosphotransferase [Brasilonema sp. UFV-L1]|uniref:phosphotransferase n=1 Tax=Brasilonema sp. UFV-L1 TaxID=2234130 RepID=UPI00145CC7C7|nr:phosphotransferase [Brasilonema sp. UFV-L1]NMG07587.1 hypothetical protein [Brasilonema sp. UFV-L1]